MKNTRINKNDVYTNIEFLHQNQEFDKDVKVSFSEYEIAQIFDYTKREAINGLTKYEEMEDQFFEFLSNAFERCLFHYSHISQNKLENEMRNIVFSSEYEDVHAFEKQILRERLALNSLEERDKKGVKVYTKIEMKLKELFWQTFNKSVRYCNEEESDPFSIDFYREAEKRIIKSFLNIENMSQAKKYCDILKQEGFME